MISNRAGTVPAKATGVISFIQRCGIFPPETMLHCFMKTDDGRQLRLFFGEQTENNHRIPIAEGETATVIGYFRIRKNNNETYLDERSLFVETCESNVDNVITVAMPAAPQGGEEITLEATVEQVFHFTGNKHVAKCAFVEDASKGLHKLYFGEATRGKDEGITNKKLTFHGITYLDGIYVENIS